MSIYHLLPDAFLCRLVTATIKVSCLVVFIGGDSPIDQVLQIIIWWWVISNSLLSDRISLTLVRSLSGLTGSHSFPLLVNKAALHGCIALIEIHVIVPVLLEVCLVPDNLLKNLVEVILVLLFIAAALILIVIVGSLIDVSFGMGLSRTRGFLVLGWGCRAGPWITFTINLDKFTASGLRRLVLLIGAQQLINHVPVVVELILRLLDVFIFEPLPHLLRNWDLFICPGLPWQGIGSMASLNLLFIFVGYHDLDFYILLIFFSSHYFLTPLWSFLAGSRFGGLFLTGTHIEDHHVAHCLRLVHAVGSQVGILWFIHAFRHTNELKFNSTRGFRHLWWIRTITTIKCLGTSRWFFHVCEELGAFFSLFLFLILQNLIVLLLALFFQLLHFPLSLLQALLPCLLILYILLEDICAFLLKFFHLLPAQISILILLSFLFLLIWFASCTRALNWLLLLLLLLNLVSNDCNVLRLVWIITESSIAFFYRLCLSHNHCLTPSDPITVVFHGLKFRENIVGDAYGVYILFDLLCTWLLPCRLSTGLLEGDVSVGVRLVRCITCNWNWRIWLGHFSSIMLLLVLVRRIWLRVILTLSRSFLFTSTETCRCCFAEYLLLMQDGVTEFLKEEFIGHNLADAMAQDRELA